MTRQSERLEAEAQAARQRLSLALEELRVRLRPTHVLDQLAQSGTGEFFANFARDIRDNPLSVAFFGASLALLLAPRIRDVAANAARRSSEAARSAAARAQSATAAAGERASGAAWEVSRAADTAASLDEVASTGYRRAARATAGSLRDFLALTRQQPVVLAGIGLGVGAALGVLMALGSRPAEPADVETERLREESQEYVAAEQARAPQEVPELATGAPQTQPVGSVEATAGGGGGEEAPRGPA